MSTTINSKASTIDESRRPLSRRAHPLLPWLSGSGIALGQAALATACTVPTLGQCAGCGSCALAVATLTGWALKQRQADAALRNEQGLEPFERRTANLAEPDR
jgi:hypothetical protein